MPASGETRWIQAVLGLRSGPVCGTRRGSNQQGARSNELPASALCLQANSLSVSDSIGDPVVLALESRLSVA